MDHPTSSFPGCPCLPPARPQAGNASVNDLFDQIRRGLEKIEEKKPPHERMRFSHQYDSVRSAARSFNKANSNSNSNSNGYSPLSALMSNNAAGNGNNGNGNATAMAVDNSYRPFLFGSQLRDSLLSTSYMPPAPEPAPPAPMRFAPPRFDYLINNLPNHSGNSSRSDTPIGVLPPVDESKIAHAHNIMNTATAGQQVPAQFDYFNLPSGNSTRSATPTALYSPAPAPDEATSSSVGVSVMMLSAAAAAVPNRAPTRGGLPSRRISVMGEEAGSVSVMPFNVNGQQAQQQQSSSGENSPSGALNVASNRQLSRRITLLSDADGARPRKRRSFQDNSQLEDTLRDQDSGSASQAQAAPSHTDLLRIMMQPRRAVVGNASGSASQTQAAPSHTDLLRNMMQPRRVGNSSGSASQAVPNHTDLLRNMMQPQGAVIGHAPSSASQAAPSHTELSRSITAQPGTIKVPSSNQYMGLMTNYVSRDNLRDNKSPLNTYQVATPPLTVSNIHMLDSSSLGQERKPGRRRSSATVTDCSNKSSINSSWRSSINSSMNSSCLSSSFLLSGSFVNTTDALGGGNGNGNKSLSSLLEADEPMSSTTSCRVNVKPPLSSLQEVNSDRDSDKEDHAVTDGKTTTSTAGKRKSEDTTTTTFDDNGYDSSDFYTSFPSMFGQQTSESDVDQLVSFARNLIPDFKKRRMDEL